MDADDCELSIGGVGFSLLFPAGWGAPLVKRYAEFLGHSSPAWRLVVRHNPAVAGDRQFRVWHEPSITHFQTAGSVGDVDLERRVATVSVANLGHAPAALERAMAFICMQELTLAGTGLLLHGAGVAWQDVGYAFCGASGAGKTTLATLVRGRATVLCDENLIVHFAAEGPRLCSTPFWGMSTPPEIIARRNRQAPLRALCVLAHGPEFRLTRLSPSRAAVALLATEKAPVERREGAQAWLSAVARLTVVPIFLLEFCPRSDLWDIFVAAIEHEVARESARCNSIP